jgi:hypothetical protein
MAFSGLTSQQYEDFLSDGGELTLTLDRSDFSRNGEFEHFPDLQDRLDTGFELPPPSLVEEPAARSHILVHGDQWSRTRMGVLLNPQPHEPANPKPISACGLFERARASSLVRGTSSFGERFQERLEDARCRNKNGIGT